MSDNDKPTIGSGDVEIGDRRDRFGVSASDLRIHMPYAERKRLVKAYQRKFGGQPFDHFHERSPAATDETFRLMAKALEIGEPISEADKARLNPQHQRGLFVR